MRKPAVPPQNRFDDLNPQERLLIADAMAQLGPEAVCPRSEYLHWDVLRNKKPPIGLSKEHWWQAVKLSRSLVGTMQLPLMDTEGKPFHWLFLPHWPSRLLKIQRSTQESSATFSFGLGEGDRYLVNSLIEESISSSQLEGASTTRQVAKQMLLSQRKPRTLDERMIVNNYHAMEFIRAHRRDLLSVDFILAIHGILMDSLLAEAGRLRVRDDILVTDSHEEVVHIPPKATELSARLQALCEWANTVQEEIPPIIKAILLHLALAYDHPFEDGNGRTARAIFYWFMLHQGYGLMEYVSISQVLKKAPIQYGRAFLYTETDDNDATYFIEHQLGVIEQAVAALEQHLVEQLRERKQIEFLQKVLPDRQMAVVAHALKHPKQSYLIEHHRHSHGISYQSARMDLLALADCGLLVKRKRGKAFVFEVPSDLRQKLGDGSGVVQSPLARSK